MIRERANYKYHSFFPPKPIKSFQDVHAGISYYYDWIRKVMSGNTKCTGFSSTEA